jgi:hypothetical protein
MEWQAVSVRALMEKAASSGRIIPYQRRCDLGTEAQISRARSPTPHPTVPTVERQPFHINSIPEAQTRPPQLAAYLSSFSKVISLYAIYTIYRSPRHSRRAFQPSRLYDWIFRSASKFAKFDSTKLYSPITFSRTREIRGTYSS